MNMIRCRDVKSLLFFDEMRQETGSKTFIYASWFSSAAARQSQPPAPLRRVADSTSTGSLQTYQRRTFNCYKSTCKRVQCSLHSKIKSLWLNFYYSMYLAQQKLYIPYNLERKDDYYILPTCQQHFTGNRFLLFFNFVPLRQLRVHHFHLICLFSATVFLFEWTSRP